MLTDVSKPTCLWASLIGVLFFALYLHTAGPGLVPYRDAGEMASSVPTLGILHPTSYPFYSVAGHLFGRLPLGNPAYRLNVFSGAAMAAAWVFLYLALIRRIEMAPALMVVALGAVSHQFWTHALVSEMYALNLVFLAAVWFLLESRRRLLAALVFGLGLSNRGDLVLCLPAFLILAAASDEQPKTPVPWPAMALLGAVGFGLYLYLPLRAGQRPWLNWNDPSTLTQFMGSLLRRGYGGTLDVLSQSYGLGENFFDEFQLYLLHLWKDFTFLALPLAALGAWALWKRTRWYVLAVLFGFFITGPLFIFLGNLPQNPHAVAIMQAAYLVPDFFFLIACAHGAAVLSQRSRVAMGFTTAVLAACAVYLLTTGYGATGKRMNFMAIDFIHNVNHTVPAASIIVGRSDVPLFSLFYGHWIQPRPEGRLPVAQGLAASRWYQRMLRDQLPELYVGSLKTTAEWGDFTRLNNGRSVFVTQDLDWPGTSSSNFRTFGLVSLYETIPGSSPLHFDATQMRELYRFRGVYRYGQTADFFSNELIEEYAKAWVNEAQDLLRAQQLARAETEFRRALAFKPDMPYAGLNIAYIYYLKQDFPTALRYYRWSVDLFARMNREALAWRTLPAVLSNVRIDWAGTLAQEGVVEEHLGDVQKAQQSYETALEIDPACADAHYNIAVLYWKQANWQAVVDHLQALARTHPNDPRWKTYLPAAMAHLR